MNLHCPIKSALLPLAGFQLRSSRCLFPVFDLPPAVISPIVFLISHYLQNLQKVRYLCSLSTPQPRLLQIRQRSRKMLVITRQGAHSCTEHSHKLLFLWEAKLRLKNPKWFRLLTVDFILKFQGFFASTFFFFNEIAD